MGESCKDKGKGEKTPHPHQMLILLRLRVMERYAVSTCASTEWWWSSLTCANAEWWFIYVSNFYFGYYYGFVLAIITYRLASKFYTCGIPSRKFLAPPRAPLPSYYLHVLVWRMKCAYPWSLHLWHAQDCLNNDIWVYPTKSYEMVSQWIILLYIKWLLT